MGLKTGTRVGPYEITARIGAGGMGEVYRATDTKLRRDVAIKVLPDDLARDGERLARFEREAHLLASLNHPNIASIYGLEETGDAPCLVLELVEGETLADRVARGPLPMAEAREIALQITAALEAAHDKGIVHRDLKPANVKVTPEGAVKVLDFGLAKAMADELTERARDVSLSPTVTAATRAGVIVGTAAYMSPEQARGRSVDKRTDIWAFGCVLYEMLTGRGVFHGPTSSDCIAGILEREPDWSLLPPGTPPYVRRLLRRCLEKDARRRLHDIADARIEIQESLAGTDAETSGGRTEPRAKRGVSPFVWAAVGLVIGAALSVLVSGPGSGGSSIAPSPGRFTMRLPQEAPLLPTPATSSVAVSPDGSVLVYVGVNAELAGTGELSDGPSSSNRSRLFARRTDEYGARELEGTIGATSPFFSPDGEWVGFIDSSDGRLKKTRLRGGVPVPLTPEPIDLRGACWGEDGRIYLGGSTTGIRSVSENGGGLTTLTTPDRDHGEKSHRFPFLLPGGRALLFTLATSRISSYDEAGIALLDLVTGRFRLLMEGGTQPSYVATGHLLYGRAGSLWAAPFDLDAGEITGPPFGTGATALTSDGWGSAHYGVSATGMLAYVAASPDTFQLPVYWIDRQGRVDRVPLEPRPYGKAVFSPDGGRLALSSLGGNASIWVYDIERRTSTRLTHEWDNYAPIWTRSGRYVTYSSDRSEAGQIWQVAADGSSAPEQLAPELLFDNGYYAGSWSLDDRSLLVSVFGATTGLDIWLLPAAEGGKLEPFIQTRFDETDPAVSPDGRWLAYTSNATGQTELYVQRFPDGGRRWQISAGGGQAPLWSPDMRELYYWKGRRLMAVSVITEPDFAPGKERELPQPLFSELASWDVAPDGTRFVVVGRLAGDASAPSTGSPGGVALTPRPLYGRQGKLQSTIQEIQVVVDWLDWLRRNPS